MSIFNEISRASLTNAQRAGTAIREFVSPSYHPERHYMRGPGPACARRVREHAATPVVR